MQSFKRALGAGIASSIVVAGMGVGLAGSAQAEPPNRPRAEQIDLPLPLPALPLPDVLPVLGGLGEVGGLLSVTEPVWNLLGTVTTQIVWLRDGVPIPGTEGVWDYIPTGDDAGHEISAMLTSSLLGFLDLTMITNALGIPLLGEEDTTPVATTAPKITGEAKVGKVLTGSAPTWDKAVDTTTYQWLRAGAPIAGATTLTYTVAAEDVGKAIALRATGTQGSATPGTSTSAPVTGIIGDAPTASTAPAISGTPKVGETLTVSAPVWSLPTVATTYQWLRAGVAIAGATGSTYALTAEDVGAAITARATGTRNGYTPGTATSAPVTGALGDAPAPTSAPTVVGTAKIGEQLVANPGAWGTPEPDFAYQWLRDGAAIPGATSATYTVLPTDATHSLAFAVTATRAGYQPGSATANGVTIPKLTSKTQLSLVTKQVKKGKRGVLKIVLTATGAKPAGTVKVYDGAKLLKGYSVRVADNGVRIVKLPVLKPGKHKIKGVYAGSSSIVGSTSRVVTLKVLKKK